MEEWGTSLQKATNGTVTFAVFPAQQLGKAFDHYDMARDGIADVTYINPGYQPGRFPIIGAGELPFLMSDAKGGSQALDAWYRAYAEKEMKDVKFCLGFVHDPGAIHSRTKKVMVPGDIKGMKIRPAHATMASFITRLGGTNIQSSAPEVRDILEKGVADAVTFPWGSVPLFGIDKVTKYHMEVPLYATTFAWVMNKNTYNNMSAAQKRGGRQPLQQRVGVEGGRSLGRLRARRRPEAQVRSRARGVHDFGRAGRGVAQGRRAVASRVGRERPQGRRRPGCDFRQPQIGARQVQRGLLIGRSS